MMLITDCHNYITFMSIKGEVVQHIYSGTPLLWTTCTVSVLISGVSLFQGLILYTFVCNKVNRGNSVAGVILLHGILYG